MWFKRVKINSLKLYALKACPYEKKKNESARIREGLPTYMYIKCPKHSTTKTRKNLAFTYVLFKNTKLN